MFYWQADDGSAIVFYDFSHELIGAPVWQTHSARMTGTHYSDANLASRLDDERFIFATDASKSKQGHECMVHDQSVVIAGTQCMAERPWHKGSLVHQELVVAS